ncbi:hypothetical protein [Pseudomonas fluorescens]|nr:hypothetical protein [Pseudomonas fluorescens]
MAVFDCKPLQLYVYERVQNSAKKRRDVELREIGQRRLADMERHSLELQRRELSRQRWQAKERRNAPGADVAEKVARANTASPTPKSATSQDVMAALSRLMANNPAANG